MKLIQGDCIEVMKTLEAGSVDTVITDPPYGLNFMGKDWDKFKNNENPAGGNTGKDTPYARNRVAPAFYHYGLEEKNTLQEFSCQWATEALRVAKPGAFMLCFGGTRTFHRIACGIEDAGWEVRDTMMWLYGSGFPKSYNISKGIDKKFGAERKKIPNPLAKQQTAGIGTNAMGDKNAVVTISPTPITDQAKKWDGWGTALKPAFEPIIVCMKPIEGTYVENALKHGVAGLNIDGGRVPTEDTVTINTWDNGAKPFGDGAGNPYSGREETKGRFPANLVHDGSEEVLAGFPQTKSGKCPDGFKGKYTADVYGEYANNLINPEVVYGDSGSAARFFYCAKASKAERNAGLEGMEEKPSQKMGDGLRSMVGHPSGNEGNTSTEDRRMKNNHPTVKPLSLMTYLCKLTKTPTGGTVLDPFMGSGTTGMACKATGRDFVGIELDEHYFKIAEKRINSPIQQELI